MKKLIFTGKIKLYPGVFGNDTKILKIEAYPMKDTSPEKDMSRAENCSPRSADFWSIKLHTADGMMSTLADCDSKVTCTKLLSLFFLVSHMEPFSAKIKYHYSDLERPKELTGTKFDFSVNLYISKLSGAQHYNDTEFFPVELLEDAIPYLTNGDIKGMSLCETILVERHKKFADFWVSYLHMKAGGIVEIADIDSEFGILTLNWIFDAINRCIVRD